jgi:hypothetical protein
LRKSLAAKTYKENDSVIYTDNEGNQFHTFVIFDTDSQTGLTYINFHNLQVRATALEFHPHSTGMPMKDPFSFELFRKLKEKYARFGRARKKDSREPKQGRSTYVVGKCFLKSTCRCLMFGLFGF